MRMILVLGFVLLAILANALQSPNLWDIFDIAAGVALLLALVICLIPGDD